jgi:hypothetical protein
MIEKGQLDVDAQSADTRLAVHLAGFDDDSIERHGSTFLAREALRVREMVA